MGGHVKGDVVTYNILFTTECELEVPKNINHEM